MYLAVISHTYEIDQVIVNIPKVYERFTLSDDKKLYFVEGPWGYWYVSFFQQVASIGNNVAIQIAAGSSLKAVYKHYYTGEDGAAVTLQHFILLFGAFEMFLSQLPDIHSLRWVNATCTASTIGFAMTAISVTLYDGKRSANNNFASGTEIPEDMETMFFCRTSD
jgi:hypothetical protein